MAKHNFREIKAWQKALELTPDVYRLTNNFPEDEKYALTSQVKRAVVSISSNIAEGSGRNTDNDFAYFLDMALGSACELESDLLVALELKFLSAEQFQFIFEMITEVKKLIIGFQNFLRK